MKYSFYVLLKFYLRSAPKIFFKAKYATDFVKEVFHNMSCRHGVLQLLQEYIRTLNVKENPIYKYDMAKFELKTDQFELE